MKLDDVEKLARAIEERRTGSLTFKVTTELASALLAVLPVVRAAEALADYDGLSDDAEALLINALAKSVDEMRALMGGGGR